MKKVIILSLILVIALGIGGMFYFKSATSHPFRGNDEIVVEVKKGYTFYNILEDLDKKKAIINPSLIKAYVKINKISPKIIPGNFKVPSTATIEEFVKILGNSNLTGDNITVTIPEGYDIEAMGKAFEEKGLFSKNDFIKAVKEYSLPTYIEKRQGRKYELEGFLFPDTYKFNKGISPKEVIKIMNDKFNEEITSLSKNYEIKNEDIYKLVTMASIVEKEAVKKEERAIVASVFYNRLNIKMKFQSCATVLYSLGEHRDKLYEKDLEVQSPYNTYKVDGLPVGPIASPGRESIIAAIEPAKTNYIYFVSKNDGTHFFTNDYNEFLKVKEQTQGF